MLAVLPRLARPALLERVRPVFVALSLVALGRLVYGLAAALVAPASSSPLIAPWQQFDALHFESIATRGYSGRYGGAFLPLYPALEAAAGRLVGGVDLGGLVVSTLALGVAVVLLLKYVEPILGRSVAYWGALLLVVAPVAVFLFAGYSDSLFLAEVLGVFLLAHRGRLGWAGVVGGVAVLTRDQGLLLAPALILGLALSAERPRSLSGWAVAAVRLGAPSVMALAGIVVAWERMGMGSGPWASEVVLGQHASLPWLTVLDSVRLVLRGSGEEMLSLAAVTATAATLPWVWRHLGATMGCYQGLSLLLTLSHASGLALMSADRFTLAVPGVVIAVAAWTARRRPLVGAALTLAALLIASRVLGLFVSGVFVG